MNLTLQMHYIVSSIRLDSNEKTGEYICHQKEKVRLEALTAAEVEVHHQAEVVSVEAVVIVVAVEVVQAEAVRIVRTVVGHAVHRQADTGIQVCILRMVVNIDIQHRVTAEVKAI